MYRTRNRIAVIAATLLMGTGALALIPAAPERVAEVQLARTSSQETIAAIDAMLGPRGNDVTEVGPVGEPTPIEPERTNIRPASLTAPAAEPGPVEESPLEPEPAIDPSLRPDSIAGSAVNLRAGPSTANASITVLQPGQKLHVGAIEGSWVEVTLDDGTTGWVFARYLASQVAAQPAAPAQTATASTRADTNSGLAGRTARLEARMDVRAQPNGRTVFRTQPGERVRIIGTESGWLQIRTADGTTGWIQYG